MASFPDLWPYRPSDSSEGSRTFRRRLVIAAFVVAASVIAFALTELATQGNHAVRSTPEFLTKALGAPAPSTSLVRAPAPKLEVAIRDHGFTYSDAGSPSIGLSAVGLTGGAWKRYAHGTLRSLPIGSEAVTITGDHVEHLVTVNRHIGTKTWSWRIDTKLLPRLSSNGYVGFIDKSTRELLQLQILPAAIYDRSGHDVTPKGSHWSLATDAHGALLTLTVDDRAFPLPYTIDPIVSRTSAVSAMGTSPRSTAALPGTVETGDLIVVHVVAVRNTTTDTNSLTLPTLSSGETLAVLNASHGSATGGAAGVLQATWWARASSSAAGATASASWATVADNGVVEALVFAGANTSSAANLVATTPAGTSTAATTFTIPALTTAQFPNTDFAIGFSGINVTAAYGTAPPAAQGSWSKITGINGAGVSLASWYQLCATVAGCTNAATATASGGASGRALGDAIVLKPDLTAPSADTIGINETANPTLQFLDNSTFNSGNQTCATTAACYYYYSVPPGASSTFTLKATPTDAQSGPNQVQYPTLATTGFTGTGGLTAYQSGGIYTSGVFTITSANTTAPGAQTITASDNNSQNLVSNLNFVLDSTAPTGGAFTANGTAASVGGTTSYINSGTSLTIGSRTDYAETESATASGLASSTLTMATGTLSGNACSGYGAPATIAGTTTQTVASGFCYLLTLTGTDNVGNVATSISTTVKVDSSNPSAPSATGFTFSSLTNAYWPGGASATVYVKNGVTGGFTVAGSGATDTQSGVASYAYGAVAGTGWSNTLGAYTFGTTSPTGTGAVTATNNAGLTGSSTSFNAVSDANLPASGAFTANNTAASAVGTTSYINAGTTLTLNSRTDYTEAQDATHSGLVSSTLTMATGTLSANGCSGYGAPATIVGTTSQTVATAKCYLLTLTGTDNVGNAATVSTTVKVDSTSPSAPSATGFSFASLSNAYWPGGSSATVYTKSGSAGGFTVGASGATDAESSIGSYGYGAIAGTGWGNASGVYTFTSASPTGTGAVTATNNAGLTGSSTSFNAVSDANLPAGGAFSANSVAATGGGTSSYINAGTTLTLSGRTDYTEAQDGTHSGLASSTLTMATGTLSANSCAGYGAPATIVGETSQTVATGNCYLLTLTGTDNVGNATSVSTTVKVDSTNPSAPSATGFSFASLTNAYWPGGSSATVYLKSGSAGGFTVTASGASDNDTNIASYTYGAVAGTGWGDTAGAYTFTGASPTGTGAVTATNNVFLTGSPTSFNAVSDANLPTGGAFTANSVGATGGGTSSYLTAGTTLAINSRTDYAEAQDGTHSGLASSTLTMQTGSLSGNTCSSYGAPATIAGTTSQTVASGNCYLLTLTGTDNVGNATTVSTTVKVDSTSPSAPSATGFSFSSLSNAYWPGGSSATVYLHSGSTGGFTVSGSGSADADTGVNTYSYGAVAGTGWGNTLGVYTFGTTSPTGTGGVAATNNAGLTSSATNFTAVSDASDPTAGAFTANDTAATGGGTSSYLTAGTTLAINSRTDYAEAQDGTHSGLATSVLTMRTGTLSGNSCSSYGAPATITGTTSQTVASGNCYLLALTGTDNVGNATTVSTTVKVDTSAPTATSLAFGNLTSAYWPGVGNTVFFQVGGAGGFTVTPSSTDADTDVASYAYPTLAGAGWSNGAGIYSFGAASPTASGAVTATNNAGGTSAGTTFTAQADATAPTGGAFTANGTVATQGGSSSFISSGTTLAIDSRTDYAETASATESGLTTSTLTIQTGTFASGLCSGYGAPTTIAGTASQTVASGNCYLLTLTGTDNVGNSSSRRTTVKVDTSAPSAPTVSLSGSTNSYYPGSGSTVFFQSGAAGSFSASASGSSDGESDIAGFTYPALGTGFSHTAGAYDFDSSAATQGGSVTAQNNAGLSSAGTAFTAQADGSAPTSSATCDTVACAATWYTSSPVAVAIAAAGEGGASGVKRIVYTTDGSDPTTGHGTSVPGTSAGFNVSADGQTTVKWIAEDNVGNVSSISSKLIKLDTTAPSAPTTFSFTSPTSAYYPGTGSTVFFKSGGTGGFTVSASGSADSESGVPTYNYGGLGGGGWSNSGGDYSFTSSATSTQNGAVTATNGAGLTGSSTSFTAQADGSAPTSSITCNTVACSAGWYTASPVTIDIAAAGESGASGVKLITYTTDGSNPTSSGTATAVNAATTSFDVTALGTTTVKWIAEDNVGNVSTISSQVVSLDTTAPSAPSGFNFSTFDHAYYSGSGSTVYFQGAGAGGFTVDATGSSADGESGISGYTYPALGTGFSHTGGDYTFDANATTQSGIVRAQNNAGLNSTGTTFTAQGDFNAPSSSMTCNSAACASGWYTTSPVAIAISAAGESGESGVDRLVYTTDGSTPTTSHGTSAPGASASFNVSTNGTTTVKWIAEDHVGNVSGVSTQVVKLDDSAPSAPTLAYSGFDHAYYPGSGSIVYFDGGASGGFTVAASGSTDADSAIAGYTYPALGTGWSNANGDYTFTGSATTQSGSATAQNTAGLTSAGASFTARADGSAPSTSMTCNTSPCGAGWTNTVPVDIAIDGDDGTGSGVKRIVYTTDGTDPTSSGTATTVNAATATFQLSTAGTIKWFAVDNLNHASSVQSKTLQIDGTPPSAPTGVSFSGLTNGYWVSGSTVYVKGGTAGGFTVTASGAADAQSGVSGYTYPSLGAGWSNTSGDYSFTGSASTQSGSITAQNNAGLDSSSGFSFSAHIDASAPTSSITCNTAACAAGWYTTAPVSISIAAAGETGESGVKQIVYTTDGTNPNSSGTATTVSAVSAAFDVTALGATTIKWVAEDNVGNRSTIATQTVQLDTSAPSAPSLAFSGFSHAYYAGTGSTVFFQGGGAGGFTVTASGSADGDSGLAGYTYPSLGTGWGNTAGAYTFGSSAGTQSGSVTAQNNAALSSAGTGFTAQADSSAPTASIQCNAGTCSTGWYVASPVAVVIAAAGESSASGVRRVVYTTDGSDPAIDGSDNVTAGTEVAGANVSLDLSAEGTTTVKWIAEDNVGNITAVGSRTVKIDTIAPGTTIGAKPSDPSSSATPTFGFTSNEAGATFECSVDNGAYGLCVTPLILPTLGQGNHTFDVRATDLAGNVDASPATYAWTVDTVPPAASMTDPGAHVSGALALSSTSTDVGGTGIANVTFEYRTAGGGTWTPIAALPWNTTTGADSVADGLYDLHVVAYDNAGNVASSTPISNLRVDNTAPGVNVTTPVSSGGLAGTVTLTAPTTDVDPSPSIVWQVAPHGTTTWTTVPATWNTKTGTDAVADGHYDVKATATDWAGNVGSNVATDVTVDNQAPTVNTTVPADGSYVNAAAANPFTVNATATDNGTGVQQVVFSSCTTADCTGGTVTAIGTDTSGSGGTYGAAWTLPANGTYWIRAVATDNVGHASTSINAVTVDRTLPDTNLLTNAGDPTNNAHPAFTFSASESTQGYECKLDAGAWTTCSSPHTLASTPADGSHTLQIRAIDLAGNTDSSPASWTWNEDRTAPTATLTDPAAANAAHAIRGTIALGSTTADPSTNGYASGIDNATLTYEYSSDGIVWAPIGTPATWNTTAITDGVYQMHVLITDHAGNVTTSATVANMKIDNTQPVTAQDDPGANLHNTVTLTGTAADPNDPQGVAGSGVDHVDFQISPTGAGSWTSVGTDTTSPYTASYDTHSVADGHYDFRTIAYDVAGNVTNATVVANRLIDNTAPTAQIVDPGANMHATIALATNPAGTTDPGGANASGIVSASYEISAAGANTWTPVAASWNTTGNTDGLYDVRVTVRDAAGNDSSPSVVTGRRVDNTKPATTASGVPSGFSATDVTVTLNPTDAGSGVSDTLYQIDGGATQHGTSVLIPAPSNGSNDGSHTITFESVDAAGNVETQNSVTVHIDATPPACPTCSASDYVSGTVSLTASPSDSGAGIDSVAFQYSANGTTGWTTIGTDSTGTAGAYSTSWNTATPGDGAWHLRAQITDSASNVSLIDLHPGGAGVVVVDNTAPSAAVGAPTAGTFVNGSGVTISATSGDANPLTYAFLVDGSAIASGSSSSTTWDTTTVADGPVQLKVRATDPAGNATTSAAVTVTVDNQSPAPTVNDPGAAIHGSPTISATSDADTATVELQQRAQGAATWVSIATVGPPFQAAFATGSLADGTYELRAIATDGAGHSGTSAIRTVVVDNALPSGSITQPSSGNTVGGPSSQLHATASDTSGSGVQSVEFQFAPTGTNTWTSISTVTGSPYNTTWNATTQPTGDYDVRILITDVAGNTKTTTPITVHVDSTAPTVTFNNPGANLAGTTVLTATTAGPDAISVSFQSSPAGANTWQTISTDNASPWTASFDTRTVSDGLYDIRATAVDALGNVGTSTRTGIRIDNTAPSITTATPADAAVVASLSSIQLDAGEIVTVTGVTLDGLATVAPTITGSHIDFATGSLADGAHTLQLTLNDLAGKTTLVQLHFTIYTPAPGTPPPPVEGNMSGTAATTVAAPDGTYSITMPPGAWPAGANPSSWLVVRLAPTVPAQVPPAPAGSAPMEGVIEIIARWADGSGQLHHFDAPLDIAFQNVRTGLAPATVENGTWRLIQRVPTSGQLPASWEDGFYRTGSVVHVLTRHLTIFGMAVDTTPPTPPSPPTGLSGTVDNGILTLRWDPSPIDGGTIANFVVFADDQAVANLGATQYEYRVGPFDANDPHAYSVVETDGTGNASARSAAIKVVPQLAGLTLENARSTLTAKGFGVGDITVVESDEPAGNVVGQTGHLTVAAGSAVGLQVSAGPGQPATKFVFAVVGTKHLVLTQRHYIGIHLSSTRATLLDAILVNARGAHIYTWHVNERAGVTIAKLTLPKPARKPGLYKLLWTATSGGDVVRKSLNVQILRSARTAAAAAKNRKVKDVVLAGADLPKQLPSQAKSGTRLVASSSDSAFSLTGDPKLNVEVIVVDADQYTLGLVHDLRTVFPGVRLIVLTNDRKKLSRAIAAGATIALPKSTSPVKLAKVVAALTAGSRYPVARR